MRDHRCSSGVDCLDSNNDNVHRCVNGCGTHFHAICMQLNRNQCIVLDQIKSHFKLVCEECQSKHPLDNLTDLKMIFEETKAVGDYLKSEFLRITGPLSDIGLFANSIDDLKSRMSKIEANVLAVSNRNTDAVRTLRDHINSSRNDNSINDLSFINESLASKLDELNLNLQTLVAKYNTNSCQYNDFANKTSAYTNQMIKSTESMLEQFGLAGSNFFKKAHADLVKEIESRVQSSFERHQQIILDAIDSTTSHSSFSNVIMNPSIDISDTEVTLQEELASSSNAADNDCMLSNVALNLYRLQRDFGHCAESHTTDANTFSESLSTKKLKPRTRSKNKLNKGTIQPSPNRIHYCVHPSRLPTQEPTVTLKGQTQSRSGTWFVNSNPVAQKSLVDDRLSRTTEAQTSNTRNKNSQCQKLSANNFPLANVQSTTLNSRLTTPYKSPYTQMTTENTTHTWLYVSQVANDVSSDLVRDYVAGKLYRDDIHCFSLLPYRTDPATRRHLSFKLRIPSSCTYIALDPSFWPKNVRVRKFVANEDFLKHRQGTKLPLHR